MAGEKKADAVKRSVDTMAARLSTDGMVPLGVDGRAFLLYALRVAVRPQTPDAKTARSIASKCRDLVLSFDDELEEQDREARIREEKAGRELEGGGGPGRRLELD